MNENVKNLEISNNKKNIHILQRLLYLTQEGIKYIKKYAHNRHHRSPPKRCYL